MFEPEQGYYYLCGQGENNCYEELGVYGDPVREQFWTSLGKVFTSKAPREDLEALSDSPAWQKFVIEVLDEMDHVMREKLLVKLVKTFVKGI